MFIKGNVNAMATVSMFLFAIFLIFFTTQAMVWVISFCCKRPDDGDEYINPYRIVPREEHENYKRYERQEYLDSFRK